MKIRNKIRPYLKNSEAMTLLEVGCGTGLIGLEFASLFQRTLLLDGSSDMIACVQEKLKDSALAGNVEALVLDFEQERLSETFDVVLVVQVLLHIQDSREMLARLYDSLKPGGRLILVDYTRNNAVKSALIHPGFDVGVLLDELKNTGFSASECVVLSDLREPLMGLPTPLFLICAER